ncbi:hypothetical protein GN958_ATG21056 [Phytophthora infestans]|uniref:Uncharacterized protein n=1 Tax=Phytophthora infestans TaxID=4787 RepID=A0A8S9TP37_PHYIN|nr:hypothetical protein GN958_ATG21056 [Phytophthora infestans]
MRVLGQQIQELREHYEAVENKVRKPERDVGEGEEIQQEVNNAKAMRKIPIYTMMKTLQLYML